MSNHETRVQELEDAIRRYLDEFYEFDLSGERIQWPGELADLIAWVEPNHDYGDGVDL
jgi:hypothetical protein